MIFVIFAVLYVVSFVVLFWFLPLWIVAMILVVETISDLILYIWLYKNHGSLQRLFGKKSLLPHSGLAAWFLLRKEK